MPLRYQFILVNHSTVKQLPAEANSKGLVPNKFQFTA